LIAFRAALSDDARDGVRVGNATIVASDFEIDNDVIHIIDRGVLKLKAVLLAGRQPGYFP
jgi:uncharacterized surface protein with fasciclin (FAS1) repeats